MKPITLYFYKGKWLISRLIQLRTFSRFSHVAISVKWLVYEAHYDRGVILSNSPTTYNKSEYEELTIYVKNYQEYNILEFLGRQVGKKYDFLAIISFFTRENNRNDNGRFFCSELASIALWCGWVIAKPKKLISPWELYEMLSAIIFTELKLKWNNNRI